MNFTRSNSGISNTHSFVGADVVVYTEGGDTSYTAEQIDEGLFNQQSIDIKFWSGLFSATGFNKKAEFRALGSKTASKNIRKKIINNEISNTAVVVDKDLDFILHPIEPSPFIIYTKGYSWENDVYTEGNTYKQAHSLINSQYLPEEAIKEIKDAYTDFIRISKRLLRLEIIFRQQKKKFITEVNGERFFNHKQSIKINKKELLLFIKSKKVELPNRPAHIDEHHSIGELCALKDNYGKLVAAFSINVISYIAKKYASYKSIPSSILENYMIDLYIHNQQISCDQYYQQVITELQQAL